MLKFLRTLFLFPLLLITTVLWGIGRIAYELSGIAVGFVILFLGIIGIYHVFMHAWYNVIFLGITECCLILLLSGAAVMVCLMETARDRILEFMEGTV